MELNSYIKNLQHVSAPDAVTKIAELLPSATPTVSYTGVRLFSCDGYEGNAKLNDLGRLYLRKGVFEPNAPLSARLKHDALQDRFEDLYELSDAAIDKTRVAWLFTWCRDILSLYFGSAVVSMLIGCGYSAGLALEFTPDQYERLWPNTPSVEINHHQDGTRTLSATREMVEEAASRPPPGGQADS